MPRRIVPVKTHNMRRRETQTVSRIDIQRFIPHLPEEHNGGGRELRPVREREGGRQGRWGGRRAIGTPWIMASLSLEIERSAPVFEQRRF
jgi:hypothetical protein